MTYTDDFIQYLTEHGTKRWIGTYRNGRERYDRLYIKPDFLKYQSQLFDSPAADTDGLFIELLYGGGIQGQKDCFDAAYKQAQAALKAHISDYERKTGKSATVIQEPPKLSPEAIKSINTPHYESIEGLLAL